VVLFAIPLFAARRIGLRAPLWLRVASASGALVSLLYIALTIVPIVQVENRLAFAVKLIAVAVVLNLAGDETRSPAARRAPWLERPVQRYGVAAAAPPPFTWNSGCPVCHRQNEYMLAKFRNVTFLSSVKWPLS